MGALILIFFLTVQLHEEDFNSREIVNRIFYGNCIPTITLIDRVVSCSLCINKEVTSFKVMTLLNFSSPGVCNFFEILKNLEIPGNIRSSNG